MHRRTFLRRLATGIVATAALAHVPAAVVKAIVGPERVRHYAIEELTRVYNAAAKGKGAAQAPREIHVGREFFEAYEQELPSFGRWTNPQFSAERNLRFKGCTVRIVRSGWHVEAAA
jgi:hypothetical protein